MASECLKLLIKNQNIHGLAKFLNEGGNVNGILKNGMTPLSYAIQQSYVETTSALVGDNKFSMGDEIVLYLLRAGADVNTMDLGFQRTPLSSALYYKRRNEVIYELINAGSRMNAESRNRFTPLIYAVKRNYHSTLINDLICMGADVNHRDSFGRTALFYALHHTDSFEVVTLLLDAGARINICDSCGRNLLVLVNCENCNEGECKNKHVIDLLVRKGVDLRQPDNDGKTVIHWINCNYLISLCMKCGVAVDCKDNNGLTPLMDAVRTNNADKVKRLLSIFNANPNCVDSKLLSPLHYAVMLILPEIMSLIIYYGGDLCTLSVDRKTPLDLLLGLDIYDSDLSWDALCVPLIIKDFILFLDETILNVYFRNQNDSIKKRVYLFIEECKSEVRKMQNIYITENLTFYNFCILKKSSKSKIIDISINEYNYNYKQIKELLPLYQDLIIMRMKDNERRKTRRDLLANLENIVIRPLQDSDKYSPVELIYDCKYHIGRYLNSSHLYKLFQASTEH